MKITNCKFLKLFQINGIVLWPFVLYAEKFPLEEVMRHEQVHLEQIRKDGVLTFYLRYLEDYLKGRANGLSHHEAYLNIPYEKEAYEKQRLV